MSLIFWTFKTVAAEISHSTNIMLEIMSFVQSAHKCQSWHRVPLNLKVCSQSCWECLYWNSHITCEASLTVTVKLLFTKIGMMSHHLNYLKKPVNVTIHGTMDYLKLVNVNNSNKMWAYHHPVFPPAVISILFIICVLNCLSFLFSFLSSFLPWINEFNHILAYSIIPLINWWHGHKIRFYCNRIFLTIKDLNKRLSIQIFFDSRLAKQVFVSNLTKDMSVFQSSFFIYV